jgi:hypothetical protein
MSESQQQDPRVVELTAINRRLKTVMTFLKTKHTPESIDRLIGQAETGLGDHTAAFVPVENTIVQGTRHMGALLQLADILELKGEIGCADKAFSECTALLERKVELLKSIYR